MKLLWIGVDGLRLDLALPEQIAADERFQTPDHPSDPRFSSGGADHTLAPGQARAFGVLAPTLARLCRPGARSDGRLVPVWMTPPTDSGPGWSSLLTGSTHEQCNVWWNEFVGHRLAVRPDILTRIWAAAPAARTMAATSWDALTGADGPGPILQQRLDQQRTGQHLIIEAFGHDLAQMDAQVRTRACLALNHDGPDASFVYLQDPDHQAHLHGTDSEPYRAAIRQADESIRYLVKAVAERHEALGEDWLVAVTTDHGHKPEGGHGEDEVEVRRSFLLVHRIGQPLPADLDPARALRSQEVTPFLLHLLGVEEGHWAATHPVGSRTDLPPHGPTRQEDFEW